MLVCLGLQFEQVFHHNCIGPVNPWLIGIAWYEFDFQKKRDIIFIKTNVFKTRMKFTCLKMFGCLSVQILHFKTRTISKLPE